MLVFRARDHAWSVRAEVRVDAGAFRLLLRLDTRHWYALDLRPGSVSARLRIGPLETEVATAALDANGPSTLCIEAREAAGGGPDDIVLGFESDHGHRTLAALDGRYLSTGIAGGFTGRVIGLQARSGTATVHEVAYTTR